MILKENNNKNLIDKRLIILKRKRLLDFLNTPDNIIFSLLKDLFDDKSFKKCYDSEIVKYRLICSLQEGLEIEESGYNEWIKRRIKEWHKFIKI